jgi:hypothetical protein
MRWLRDQLLRIPVVALCVAAIALFALLLLIGDRAGENGVLFVRRTDSNGGKVGLTTNALDGRVFNGK